MVSGFDLWTMILIDITIHYLLGLDTIGSLPDTNTGEFGSLLNANKDVFSTFPTYVFRVKPTYVLSDTIDIDFTCILQIMIISWRE